MSQSSYDVCAIGNALVDIITEAGDAFLTQHKITKGSMTLIDATRAQSLYDMMGETIEMSGGSAGNTVAGIASLGGNPAYMGKVRDDQFGSVFRHDLRAIGVHFATLPSTVGPPTGQCLIVVSPDAQRSMSTYLGAAVEFGASDIDATIIQNAQITYLEGYLFDRPDAKQAFRHAATVARNAGRKISLTLSDTFCVERHRPEFINFIKEGVDILFANEHEIMALHQTQDLEKALAATRGICEISVTTRGAKGAVITAHAATVSVEAASVPKIVDTTGAGDLYAAGFLFGLTHDRTLEECGKIGALAAAEVISHYGPRPQMKLKDLLSAL